MREVRSIAEIDLNSDGVCLFVTRKPDSISEAGYKFRLIYSTLPEWVKRFNFNNWVERTKLWSVYEMNVAERGCHSYTEPALIQPGPMDPK